MAPRSTFAYATLDIHRLELLRAQYHRLLGEGQIGTQLIWRRQLAALSFAPPADFSDARSVNLIALFAPPMKAVLRHQGQVYRFFLPAPYYSLGVSTDALQAFIRREVIGRPGYRVEPAAGLPLKALAVGSGLARYGRNNLVYVSGMGSFVSLEAFFTNAEGLQDRWVAPRVLDQCRGCRLCVTACPGGAIPSDAFLLKGGRCITLFNEIPGLFPAWMKGRTHDALMGCLRCQWVCPANREAMGRLGQLDPLNEEETDAILSGTPGDPLPESVRKKWLRSGTEGSDDVAVWARNLRALLENGRLSS